MGEAKQARKRVNDLETQVVQLMLDVETERQLVEALTQQLQIEVERRNHRIRQGFEWE